MNIDTAAALENSIRHRDKWHEEWRKACRDEIAFLKSLRQTEIEK